MFNQLIKYSLVVVASYFSLIIGTYLLVEKLTLSPEISYFYTISLVYIGVYIALTKFVFTVDFSKKRATKYILTLVIFWVFNNLFFNVMVKIFSIQYLFAIILNIVLFGFIRFFVQRNLVFNK